MDSQKTDGPYDVAVAGLGVMGSATAWQIARRGLQVLGLEAHQPFHTLGSSHGRTRIIREAYFEHPLYVPLVRRSYLLWAALEHETGRPLLRQTGGLMVGSPGSGVFAGALRSAREHALPHEVLTSAELRRRFPLLTPAEGMAAVLEPRAGLLLAEACVDALQQAARAHGALLRHGTPVRSWEAGGPGVVVTTSAGRLAARHLVLCAGPWLPGLAASLALPLQVERQLSHWFEPAREPEAFAAVRCPVTIWEHEPGRIFYTIPDPGGHGFKAGIHHDGERVDPDSARRDPTPADEARVRGLLDRFMPGASGRLLDARVCLYTNAPDERFLIGRHPAVPQVLLASACSGHGFKFAPAIGEALAELVTRGRSELDLSAFSLGRFSSG
ncbi:MAG TPA: N-methyl-L-tryptophan oxidase [Vicinamibacteria bacterium]|nr:N-methyl-L-tryptophan oxidase [Vicinamibacteria bacterium]